MSTIRPECKIADPNEFAPKGVTAYLSIYNAVKGEKYGLIHGRLDDWQGHHCAIGSYFHAAKTALPTDILEEVATVNDSCCGVTPKQRRTAVLRWLRWKLDAMGYKMPRRPPKKK